MTLFPRHPILRVVATAWLLASLIMLTVTLLRPEMGGDDRSALSTLVPLYFLSLPLGHIAVVATGWLRVELYVSHGAAPGVLLEGLALWTLLTLLGYLQWFLLLPWVARKARQATDFLSNRHLAR